MLVNLSSSSPWRRSLGTLPIIRRGFHCQRRLSVKAAFSRIRVLSSTYILLPIASASGMVYALVRCRPNEKAKGGRHMRTMTNDHLIDRRTRKQGVFEGLGLWMVGGVSLLFFFSAGLEFFVRET